MTWALVKTGYYLLGLSSPVFHMLDSTIHRINHYPTDKW